MEQIKRMILLHVPVSGCNFRCKYCYITIQKLWNSSLPYFEHSPEEVGRAFSQERLGGTCFFNICGSGETLIHPGLIDIIHSVLLQGHYVEVVTNGSLTKRFEKIVEFPLELLERLSFKFSFHYLELKRLNMFDEFFNNIQMIKNAGCSFTVEMTATDNLEPFIDDIKKICMENLGALCHLTIVRDDSKENIPVLSAHSLDEYYNIWKQFNSDMLDFKKNIFGIRRNEFCYAGDWTLSVTLSNGAIRKCYNSPIIGNIYENLEEPIKFEAIGKCPIPHCYNGHAHLAFGVIPELDTPSYADIRNRKCIDGSEWLSPKMKNFMSSKLYKSNNEYGQFRKKKLYMVSSGKILKSNIYNSIRKRMTEDQVYAIKKMLKK